MISGAHGYIGSSLTTACLAVGHEAVPLSRPIDEPGRWGAVLEGTDAVVHLAGQTSLSEAERRPYDDFRSNVLPMAALTAACVETGLAPRIVNAGTVTEVGFTDNAAPRGATPDKPCTTYDHHKLLAEQILAYHAATGPLDGCTLRLANVYGLGQLPSSPDRGILNRIVSNAVAGKPLTIYGEGAYVRDYIHLDDVVRAFLAAVVAPGRLKGEALEIGSGHGTSIAEAFALASQIAGEHTGIRPPLVHVPEPETLSRIDRRSFVADIEPARKRLEWSPHVTLSEGIRGMIDALVTRRQTH